MKIREIKCKTALSKSNLPGLDYSLNPYRGCEHKCVYCYVPNVLRINRDEWGNFVDVKKNIPVVLAKELRIKKPGVVGMSTVTDPYQPIEEKYKITRFCLEQLLIHDFPAHIQTKSDLVIRDIDLFSKFSDIEVMFSIGTINDEERQTLEPNSASVDQRLNAMEKISNLGIKTSVFFGPIYPTIKREDIKDIIQTFKEYGVKEIMIDKFNLKKEIYDNLKKHGIGNVEKIKYGLYYNQISEEIFNICKEKKVKASSAF